ncbi:hypothetical protein Dsin_009844 [Dipteronia sinensis]|uniref:RPW8 domain-containing protein n=1 Tax=Dipteronia sinensis TaxID=43782 RepID=A0AAE0ECB3_9ROSI|nr:hypothetical protein Dsin_009844 [Dipteronia sinensis]
MALKVVTDAIGKAYKFKSELEELKSTLEAITPTLQEIDKFNGVLDIPGRETAKLKEEMIKGAKLVRESSKVKRFSCFNRVKYADKIIKLKKSIESWCNVIMQTQMARDNKRILVEVLKMRSVNEKGARVKIDGPCSVPDSLGAVFGEVLNVVKDTICKAYKFKPELEELKSTLESITPNVQEIDKLNGVLDIPGPETAKLKEEMIKGAKLVHESSKVKRFSCFNGVKYADKIIKLKKSIESWCKVIMQTQMATDNKRILVEVVKMRSVNEKGVGDRVEIDGPCSVPDSLGAVFGEVLNVVKDAICKAYKFKSELEELKSTLESITPTLQEIDKFNGVLDIPGPETAKLRKDMIKGAKLVCESSKVKRFSFFDRVNYADKIIKLKKSIETFCNVNMQIQMARDNKRILVEVDTMVKMFNRVEIDGPCSVPDSLASTPGLDVPMKELRTELLKDDGMQVIVVSAPGGAGKTTLIKKLCADDKVKGTNLCYL